MMSVLPPSLQSPPTADELALKDQVVQILTTEGVLAKLKAELRAAVFDVMHEHKDFVKPSVSKDPKLQNFPVDTRKIALSLIVECLQFFRWEHTLRVLLAESNVEDMEPNSGLLAKRLGLTTSSSLNEPVLFQLIESKIGGKSTRSNDLVNRMKEDQENEEDNCNVPALKADFEDRKDVAQTLPLNETQEIIHDQVNDNQSESSAEIEESLAEVSSELDESNWSEEKEKPWNGSTKGSTEDNTLYSTQQQKEGSGNDEMREENSDNDDHKSKDEDVMVLAEPPPAPAILPVLPPFSVPIDVSAGNIENDFDTDKEVERLRKLDAALRAMEAEDDTGTLQLLKASLQVELQEHDSSGQADEDENREVSAKIDAKESENDDDNEDGYESSDFEEEEEIASEISEVMESMEELSDESDAVSTREIELPHILRSDTRVDSEDALNGYDYIEVVEKY